MPRLDRPLAGEEQPAGDTPGGDSSTPEYVFEGFEVEFSEKIALMPAGSQ